MPVGEGKSQGCLLFTRVPSVSPVAATMHSGGAFSLSLIWCLDAFKRGQLEDAVGGNSLEPSPSDIRSTGATADPNLEEINSQRGMTGEPTGVLALHGVTLSLGYREGELVSSVVETLPVRPQPMCRALWTVLGNTHQLVAHLQVLLPRFAGWLRLPASWGCNHITGIECVQYLFVV